MESPNSSHEEVVRAAEPAPPTPTLQRAAQPAAGVYFFGSHPAGCWSLLLTPIFGSWLLARNWSMAGEEAKARQARTLAWAMAAMLAAQMFLPVSDSASRGMWLVATIVWYYMCVKPQHLHLTEAYGKDYPRASARTWLKAFGCALGALIGYVVVVAGLMTIFGPR